MIFVPLLIMPLNIWFSLLFCNVTNYAIEGTPGIQALHIVTGFWTFRENGNWNLVELLDYQKKYSPMSLHDIHGYQNIANDDVLKDPSIPVSSGIKPDKSLRAKKLKQLIRPNSLSI